MKPQRLGMLEEDATVAMDDGLWFAGGPRRKQDIERVVEIEGSKLERLHRPDKIGPIAPPRRRPFRSVDDMGAR